MIRNRLTTGLNPNGSNSNESFESSSNYSSNSSSCTNSSSGNRDRDRQRELFLPFGSPSSKGGIAKDYSNEKPETTGCCNRRQQKHSCRRIVATLLLVVFGIHQIVPLNDVVVLSDLSPSGRSYPKSETIRNLNHVSEPNTNTTNSDFLVVPRSGGNSTSDRHKPRKIIHSLPTNPSDYSAIGSIVRNYQERDTAWYNSCEDDNAAAWTANMRATQGGIGKFFNRACPNTGLHPQGVHWDPFQTPDHECPVTSRIDLQIERGDHSREDWRLQTMDVKGVPKTVGGDTFYIVYSEYIYGNDGPLQSGVPTAVAMPTDYYNGTYGLEFVSVPFLEPPSPISKHDGQRKKGKLTIHAITTCFIGTLYPPLKDGWKTGGHSKATFTIEDVDRPYKIQDWYNDRYIPQQHAETLDPNSKVLNSLSGFDRLAFAGDSMLTQMTWDISKNDYHSIVTDKIHTGTIRTGSTENGGSPSVFHMPLSPVTLQDFLDALDPWIRDDLNDNDNDNGKNDTAKANNNTNSNNVTKALVLGSAAWDIIWPAEWQGPRFENHLSALEDLLKHLRKAHPGIALVWKLPYAQHMHNANPDMCFDDPETSTDNGSCVQALRYATSERFDTLYRIQKEFIETKFGGDNMVFLLDLYEISYLAGSHWMYPGDSIHYMPSFNAAVLERLLLAEEPVEIGGGGSDKKQ